MPTILALRKKNLLFQSYAGNPSTSSCEYLACRKLFDVLQCKLVRNYLVQGSPRQLSILTCPGRKTNFLDFFGWSKTFWFQIHGGRFQIWTNSCVNVPSSNSQLVEPENLGFAAPPPCFNREHKIVSWGGGADPTIRSPTFGSSTLCSPVAPTVLQPNSGWTPVGEGRLEACGFLNGIVTHKIPSRVYEI